jgi:hypothetical protein
MAGKKIDGCSSQIISKDKCTFTEYRKEAN